MRKIAIILCLCVLTILPYSSLAEKTKLVINWGSYSDPIEKFESNHKDIKVRENNSINQIYSDLVSFFLTQNNSVDVFRVNSTLGALKPIRENGYFLDLASDKDIMNYVNAINPIIQKQMKKENEIAAIPTFFLFEYIFTINRNVQKELGITDEELPDNLLDLLRFANEWDDRFGNDYPDYHPIRVLNAAIYPVEEINPFWSVVMEKYIDSLLATGHELRFDTPLFQDLLSEIEPWSFTEQYTYWDWYDEVEDIDKCLFSIDTVADVGISEYCGCDSLIMMPIAKDWPEVVGCNIEYAFVNPASKHPLESISLVKAFMEYARPEMQRILIPSFNEPLQSSHYESDIADIKEEIERLEKLVESENDAEKKDWYNFNLGIMEKELQNMIDNPYTISPETIQEYREKMEPYLFPIGESKYDGETFYVELLNVMELLGTDGMTNDMLIHKLNDMVIKIEMECAY